MVATQRPSIHSASPLTMALASYASSLTLVRPIEPMYETVIVSSLTTGL